MMLFSQRKKAEAEFYQWAKENKASKNPANVIGWLLMDENKHWLDMMVEDSGRQTTWVEDGV